MNRRGALCTIAGAAAGLSGTAVLGAPARDSMIARKVPSSGELLPVIGMGTWQTFNVGHKAADRDSVQQVLQEFVARGGRVLDSSPMYGSAEQVAGDLAEKLGIRASLFVATKVWASTATEGSGAGAGPADTSVPRGARSARGPG